MQEQEIIEHIKTHGNTNLITDSGLPTNQQIFAIGDSHTIFYYNSMKIKEHWFYQCELPLTIYGLLNIDLPIYNIGTILSNKHELYNIKANDYVLMYFGFNDIQKNVYVYFSNEWKHKIKGFMTAYINYVISCKTKYQFIPIIPSIYPNPHEKAIGVHSNGTNLERTVYTKYANQILKELCHINNLLFLDIYDFISDENGYIKTEYSVDFIHLDYNNKFIQNYVETKIFEVIQNHQSATDQHQHQHQHTM
jgi:hypothetical protein